MGEIHYLSERNHKTKFFFSSNCFIFKNDLENSTIDASNLSSLASGHTSIFSFDANSATFGNFFSGNSTQVTKSTLSFTVEGRYRGSSLTEKVLAGFDTLGETLTKRRENNCKQTADGYEM